ncbi:DNA topoisomerase IB [Lysobacter sp. A6]|uniref:DNA topoisomerase n=1 Tax=Noviluteimonas lactosilytica TaxID=2888523 RepID=A0ABS8JFW1_9GAMM|nr:DNA topoisomerase IB [Lysobacter lactosilyticus]MCC8362482.1 DNA topoisomerase IB [Lysobacter lactosilyticus]
MAIDPNIESARNGGLTYVSDTDPGLRRKRAGRGFSYVNARGRVVRDKATLARIRSIAVPPAWRDVWICANASGHLQATGRDARGRKQYRYHPRWFAVRDTEKFDRIVQFGAALPRLRRAVKRDFALEGLPRAKVAAIVVALMADTLARVGNDEYTRDNKSFGLTTLRNQHVAFLQGGRLRLKFRGKSGQEHDIVLDDARLAKLVRHVQQLPGQSLFQYVDDDGRVQPMDSGTVNDWLREAMGDDFTAKDFRTWGATMAALQVLALHDVPCKADGSPNARAIRAMCNTAVERVARALRNTPAVCRRAYIDPAVFAVFESGRLRQAASSVRGPRQWEQAALRLLRAGHREARKNEKTA